MAYEHKEGQGSLFKNEKQNDRQPDMKGTVMIKGVLYEVAAWNRTSQSGREYVSLQVSERSGDSQQSRPAPAPVQYSPVPPPTEVPPMNEYEPQEEDLPF